MMILTGKTIVSAIRPPYPYGGEFVSQFLFALQALLVPAASSRRSRSATRAPGLQAANFLVLFGALDRLGGFFVLASIREFAPFVTAIVLAGVAGTAITADLGARKIREELDALQVLGVDPVKNLVVPRFLALMLVTGLFDIYAILFGVFGGVITTLVYDQPLGPFRATFLTNASVVGPLGLGPQVHAVRRDHRDRLLLQGHDGDGRRRGRRPRRQPGRGDRDPRRVRVQLRVHADAAGHPPRDPQPQDERGWLGSPARLGRLVRRDRQVLRARRRRGLRPEGLPLLRRGAAPGRAADPLLDARDLGPDLHHRPAVRDRGRVLQPRRRLARLRGRVRRLVRPARARPVRVRLHDGREGRHRASWPRSARCGSPTRSTRSRSWASPR